MAFNFIISPELERRLDKIAHNNKTLALAVRKKRVRSLPIGSGIRKAIS